MKSATSGLALLVATLLASAFGAGLPQAPAPTDQNFVGRVYQLDYLAGQGWTQVLVRPAIGDPLIAKTQNEPLQQILETAILNETEARVTYRAGSHGEPAELRTAVLRPTTPCTENWCVEEVRCSAAEATCFARIKGQSPDVKTESPRALGILLTAISNKKAVEDLEVKQGLIVRVKISVP